MSTSGAVSAPAGPVLLIGCGKMGGALAAGWLDAGLDPDALWIVEPQAEVAAPLAERGARLHADTGTLPRDSAPRALVVAVKPQQMDAVLPGLASFAGPDTLIVSIAAGTLIRRFEEAFGESRGIVRAMPNTPAAVGRGVTALIANDRASEAQRQLAGDLLGAVGEVLWLEDEAQMHVVTALSGGGPAYVFLLIEALGDAAVAAGLTPELAARLARQTVIGAGELARQDPREATELRRNVTSPGGTTAAALEVFMAEPGLKAMCERAIAAAAGRSRELG